MIDSFQCPYCQTWNAVSYGSQRVYQVAIDGKSGCGPRPSACESECSVEVTLQQCQKCKEYLVAVEGVGEKVIFPKVSVRPNSNAKRFPDYIPEKIRNDYEEAYAIAHLSPKASATLSRRCLQAMIRDFWGISEKTLIKEIEALSSSEKISPQDKNALHAIRQLGNIGAHPDKDPLVMVDIDPDEATMMLSVIEHFFNAWYITKHENDLLMSKVISLAQEKKNPR